MSKSIGLALALALTAATASQAAGWHRYTNSELGYSISYPSGWTVDTAYEYDGLGPDHAIRGTAFTVPAAMAAGTNLGGDTKLSVESLPGSNCQPSQFVDPAQNVHQIVSHGIGYTVATSADAGAGNRYETTVFVADGTSPCLAVRTFIHYSAIENFDPASGVKAFDRAKLLAAFDRIRATLRLGK